MVMPGGPAILKSSSSKWLAGIGLTALVLIGVSVVVTLAGRGGEPDRFAPGTPEAAVQDYLLAIEDRRDREAYDFIHPDVADGCEFDHFKSTLREVQADGVRRNRDLRVSLINVEEVDETVEVNVRVTRFYADPPFNSREHSRAERFVLEEEAGSWQLTKPPWPMNRCPDPVEPTGEEATP